MIIESSRGLEADTIDSAIEIIPPEKVASGMVKLTEHLQNQFEGKVPPTVIPIMRGGKMVGENLASAVGVEPTPMRMSYYQNDGERLPNPVCTMFPDVRRMLEGYRCPDSLLKPDYLSQDQLDTILGFSDPTNIVLAEAVVETQGTILAAMAHITEQLRTEDPDFPDIQFSTYTLIDKTSGPIAIPKLVAAFKVPKDIWVFGYGCDANGLGREESRIWGYLSPYADSTPQSPFFVELL